MRILMPIGLVIVFAGWILYRWLIKKDIRKHTNNVFAGLFFIAVWAILYFIM